MMSTGKSLAKAACLLVFLTGSIVSAGEYLSPEALVADADGKTLFIAEATAGQVAIFDVETQKVNKTISLPTNPTALALSESGQRLYVVGGLEDGRLAIVDLPSTQVKAMLDVGHSPSAVVVSKDGKKLFICNRFEDKVSVVDLESKKVAGSIAVSREPVAAALSLDGGKLFVANLLPAGPADGAYSSAVVSVVDTAADKVVSSIALPNGSMAVRDICLSPDGKFAYATHILARYQLPTTQLERGWMNTNALSVIDVEKASLVNTVLLDDVDLGAANPWGVTCTADGKNVCVALSGTQDICVIDRPAMHERLDKAAAGQRVTDVSSSADDVPNDLAFLVGIKKRIPVAGNGVRRLVAVGRKVYASEYFTGSLCVTDIDSKARRNAVSVDLGPKQEMDVVRKGEMFFHDAELCFQKWQSCNSCHPGQARADGLNWDLLNDGLGNPKNTKSMLLAHQTPPAMVSGVRGSAEVAVRAGIRHIQFAVRPDEDASAIDAYLKSLKPVASPHLQDGKLSEAASRGRKVFVEAGCLHCHPAPLYTNLKKYDVGTGVGREEGMEYDTPTLVEVWRTEPWLHDGRAAAMKDVFTKFNPNDQHGKTSKLSESELNDLIEYVLSL